MKTRRNARHYESQEKYAEALNASQKNDGIIRCYRPTRAEEGPQEDIGLVFRLLRRVDCLEQELTAIRKQLSEIAYRNAEGRCAVLHSQLPSSRPPHQDGSKRKIAYLVLEEDLIQVECFARQIHEEPVRFSQMRRAVDEL